MSSSLESMDGQESDLLVQATMRVAARITASLSELDAGYFPAEALAFAEIEVQFDEPDMPFFPGQRFTHDEAMSADFNVAQAVGLEDGPVSPLEAIDNTVPELAFGAQRALTDWQEVTALTGSGLSEAEAVWLVAQNRSDDIAYYLEFARAALHRPGQST